MLTNRARTLLVRALLLMVLGCEHSDETDGPVFPELVDMVLVPADPSDRGETGRAFFIDRYEVTNGDYQRFLEGSGYLPRDSTSFLRHWPRDASRRPILEAGASRDWRDTPVRWVDLEDARAYAAFVGKRLPTAIEWGRAARNERYPWGRHFHRYYGNVLPTGIGHPTAVGTFEEGRSPVGCYDIVGNVWEWTTTRVSSWDGTILTDAESGEAFYLIRGGSFMDPAGRGVETDHARVDAPPTRFEAASNRNAALGFRCALDAVPFVERAFVRLDRASASRREQGIEELLAFGEPLWNLVGRLDVESPDRQIWSRDVGPGTTLAGIFEGPGGDSPEVVLVQEDGRVITIGGQLGERRDEIDLLGMIAERVGETASRSGQRPRLVDSLALATASKTGRRMAFTWRIEPAPHEALWWWESEFSRGRAGVAVLDVTSGRIVSFLERPATACDLIDLGDGERLLVQVRDPARAGAYEPRIEDAELMGPFPGSDDARVLGPPAHRDGEILVLDTGTGRVTGSARLPQSDLAPPDRGSGPIAMARATDGACWWVKVDPGGGLTITPVRGTGPSRRLRLVPLLSGSGDPLVLVGVPGTARSRLARWDPDQAGSETLIDLAGVDPQALELIEPVGIAGGDGILLARPGEMMVLGLDPPRLIFRRAVASLPKLVQGTDQEGQWATFRDKGGVSLVDLVTGTVRRRVVSSVLDQAASDLDRDGQLDLCMITLMGPRLVAVSMRPASSTRGRLLARFLERREAQWTGGP